MTISVQKSINTLRVLSALQNAGLNVITIRGRGGRLVNGTHLADSAEIVLDDSADVAAAQAIIDTFDPIVAQAEIEAEEKARAEKQAALETLANWMQRNPLEAVKLMEAPAKLATLETKVAAIEAKVTVKP